MNCLKKDCLTRSYEKSGEKIGLQNKMYIKTTFKHSYVKVFMQVVTQ